MTSDERREVAERLRELAARTPRDGWMTISQNAGFIEERNYALGIQSMGLRETVKRIADLIDPTCNFEESADNDDFSIRVVFGYICHDCGHETIVESTAGGWAEPPHYCSNCGARLVSEDD